MAIVNTSRIIADRVWKETVRFSVRRPHDLRYCRYAPSTWAMPAVVMFGTRINRSLFRLSNQRVTGIAIIGDVRMPEARALRPETSPYACPAASRIRLAMISGWEIRERWLAFTSIVLAFMRLAMKRSRSGLMVRSSVETA